MKQYVPLFEEQYSKRWGPAHPMSDNKYAVNADPGIEISVKRHFINKLKEQEPIEISGLANIEYDNEGGFSKDFGASVPLLIIRDGKNNGQAYIMYDERKDEFTEGMSTWHYVYEPLTEDTKGMFDELKRRVTEKNNH